MRHNWICLAGLAAFILGSTVLGLRPYIPAWQDSLAGSNVGAYNMFVSAVDSKLVVTLLQGDKSTIIDAEKYFWMNPLVNSTHSRVRLTTIRLFAKELARRPEIQELATGTDNRIEVVLRVRKNQGRWHPIRVEVPL